jgi:hypothetical protein
MGRQSSQVLERSGSLGEIGTEIALGGDAVAGIYP